MSTTNENYLQKLFINEAKPALSRHFAAGGSSGGGGNDSGESRAEIVAILSTMYEIGSYSPLIHIPGDLKRVDSSLFGLASYVQAVVFGGKPDDIAADTFANEPNLTAIFAFWGMDEDPAGRPWGADMANIYHYSETNPEVAGTCWHYVNGEPVVWEPTPQATQGLEYIKHPYGGLMCTGPGVARNVKNIVIPDEVDGEQVKYIAMDAFGFSTIIESIILPTTLCVAYAGSLSSPSIKKIVFRDNNYESYGPEYLGSWNGFWLDGREFENLFYSPFTHINVDAETNTVTWDSNNTTLEELHVPWSEYHDFMNNNHPWGTGGQMTVYYESPECFT